MELAAARHFSARAYLSADAISLVPKVAVQRLTSSKVYLKPEALSLDVLRAVCQQRCQEFRRLLERILCLNELIA